MKIELGNKPKEATRLIQFLNSKNKYQLQELEIEYMTATIMEVKESPHQERPYAKVRGKEQGNASSH